MSKKVYILFRTNQTYYEKTFLSAHSSLKSALKESLKLAEAEWLEMSEEYPESNYRVLWHGDSGYSVKSNNSHTYFNIEPHTLK